MADHKHDEIKMNLNSEYISILYTDIVFMHVNNGGITFDICQKVGSSNQVQVVSRIGMSREHANKFVKKLAEILALTHGHSQTGNKN